MQQTHYLAKIRTYIYHYPYHATIRTDHGHIIFYSLVGAPVDLDIIFLGVDGIINHRCSPGKITAVMSAVIIRN